MSKRLPSVSRYSVLGAGHSVVAGAASSSRAECCSHTEAGTAVTTASEEKMEQPSRVSFCRIPYSSI